MVKCHVCGKEVDDKKAFKLTINGRTHYFDTKQHLNQFQPITSVSRTLSSVVLNKTSAELIAIGAGLAGIYYTILAQSTQALLMDTLSTLAAIVALVIGIEHLKYLKEHNLMRRAILLAGSVILILLVSIVWIFGFD